MTTWRETDPVALQARIRSIGKPTPAQKTAMADERNKGDVEIVTLGDIGHTEVDSVKASKFRNVKTDGYDSKREAKRAGELRLMQLSGLIRNLREQVRFEVIPEQDGERAAHYVADFVYERVLKTLGITGTATLAELIAAQKWDEVVEDAKGVRTADYILKRKLMLLVHGIRIAEV